MNIKRVGWLGGTLLCLMAAPAPAESPKLPFTIGKETTAITAPVNADGTPDYIGALNARSKEGVTPETNGFVAWMKVAGTNEGVLPPEIKDDLLKLAGTTDAGDDLFFHWVAYLRSQRVPADEMDDRTAELAAAGKRLWEPADHTYVASYLGSEEAHLNAIVAATRDKSWWIPVVAPDGKTLLKAKTALMPRFIMASDALCARAALRANGGSFNGALSDLEAVKRLGRLLGTGMSQEEVLTAASVDQRASTTLAAVLASGKLDTGQVDAVVKMLDGLPAAWTLDNALTTWQRYRALSQAVMAATGDVAPVASEPGMTDAQKDYFDAVHKMLGSVDRKNVDWDAVLKTINGHYDSMVEILHSKTLKEYEQNEDALDHKQSDWWQSAAAGGDLKKLDGETPDAYNLRVAQTILSMNPIAMLLMDGEIGRRQAVMSEQMVRSLAQAAKTKAVSESWPKTLDALPGDIFKAGQPVKYALHESGPVIYSVGPNGKDEGGVLDSALHLDDMALGADPDD